MSEPIRISPQEARQKVTAGQALLVCAYDDADKFKTNHLEGALSFLEFRSRLPGLAKNQEMIFYCAWSQEASAAGLAAKLENDGYSNVKVVKGGVEAWKAAGYPMA